MIVMMKDRVLLITLSAALLILAMSPLAASARAYEMQGLASGVTHIQYRVDDRPWTYLNPHDPRFFLSNLDADDVLEVRQASEVGEWGEPLSYRLDAEQRRWLHDPALAKEKAPAIETEDRGGNTLFAGLDLAPSEDSIALSEQDRDRHPVTLQGRASEKEDGPRPPSWTVSLAPHALFFKTAPSMDHLYAYSYGGGVDVTLSPSHTPWALSLALAVQHARSTNGWAEGFLILDSSVEAGWTLPLSSSFSLVPSLSVGALLHYTIDGSAADAWYSSLLVGASVRLSLSLTEALCLSFKPAVRLVVDETRIGLMYGANVGLNLLFQGD